MSPAMTVRLAWQMSGGCCSWRVSAEPGIIASIPGRVHGSVRFSTTASRKSTPSATKPLPVVFSARKSSTESHRSMRPDAGHATRTKHLTSIGLAVTRLQALAGHLARAALQRPQLTEATGATRCGAVQKEQDRPAGSWNRLVPPDLHPLRIDQGIRRTAVAPLHERDGVINRVVCDFSGMALPLVISGTAIAPVSLSACSRKDGNDWRSIHQRFMRASGSTFWSPASASGQLCVALTLALPPTPSWP